MQYIVSERLLGTISGPGAKSMTRSAPGKVWSKYPSHLKGDKIAHISLKKSPKCKTSLSNLIVQGGRREARESVDLKVLGYCSQATHLSCTHHMYMIELDFTRGH